MNARTKAPQDTKAKLFLELRNLKAQDIGTTKRAYDAVDKASIVRYLGSGVVVSVRDWSGKELFDPVMIQDGLGDATIEALKADIRRAHQHRLSRNTIPE